MNWHQQESTPCPSTFTLMTSLMRTGLWIMKLERKRGVLVLQVIDANTITRGARLLPVFGSKYVPEKFNFNEALDKYNTYFINRYIDQHSHEFLAL